MSYYIWIVLNLLFLICSALYIWLARPHDSTLIITAQLFAQFAIILFLINVNMYFIFMVIKRSKKRNIKVSLSKIARKMMKFHIHLAVVATSFIVFHSVIMLVELGGVIGYFHPKIISGFVSILLLCLTLIGGYRRHKKASGFRRRFHLVNALIFACAFIIHLFLPI